MKEFKMLNEIMSELERYDNGERTEYFNLKEFKISEEKLKEIILNINDIYDWLITWNRNILNNNNNIKNVNLLKSFLSKIDYQVNLPEFIFNLCFGICENHPFIDGNKRSGLILFVVLCEINCVFMDNNDLENIAKKIVGVLDENVNYYKETFRLDFINWFSAKQSTFLSMNLGKNKGIIHMYYKKFTLKGNSNNSPKSYYGGIPTSCTMMEVDLEDINLNLNLSKFKTFIPKDSIFE